jgi:hypothetical protein
MFLLLNTIFFCDDNTVYLTGLCRLYVTVRSLMLTNKMQHACMLTSHRLSTHTSRMQQHQLIWGRRRRKSRPIASPCVFPSSATHVLSGTPDPNPVQGGGGWWCRLGACPTVSGTTDASSSPLVSSLAPSNGAANGNSFAAPQRAVASEHASAGNECHIARFPPLLLRFPAPLSAINSSSPRR